MPASQDLQDRRSLAGKTALVTGASRGIGRAVATRLAARGALVAVHYGRGRREADEVVAAIVAGGHAAFAVGADLSRSSAAEDLFETLDAEFVARTGGRDLDVLVNNAGIGPRAPIEGVSTRVLDAVVQINLKAPFLLIQQASPRLRRGGRIINVSSMATQHAFPELAAYVAAKGGLRGTHARACAAFRPTRNHGKRRAARRHRDRHEPCLYRPGDRKARGGFNGTRPSRRTRRRCRRHRLPGLRRGPLDHRSAHRGKWRTEDLSLGGD